MMFSIFNRISTGSLIVLSLGMVALSACKFDAPPSNPIIQEIKRQRSQYPDRPLDLRNVAGQEWTRLCVFGPYVNDSANVLGFDWNLSAHAPVSDDMINTLVFATDTYVISFLIIPRGDANFQRLSRQCFARNQAVFFLKDKFYQHHESLTPES